VTIDSDSLLVHVVDDFDHERDDGVTLTYRCHDVTMPNVTSSCHARVVIGDVNDHSPHIKFSNSTTAKYDRLAPIEITASVRTTVISGPRGAVSAVLVCVSVCVRTIAFEVHDL